MIGFYKLRNLSSPWGILKIPQIMKFFYYTYIENERFDIEIFKYVLGNHLWINILMKILFWDNYKNS